MQRFAELAEVIAATTKRKEKIQRLADYLRELPLADAARAAVFLTGLPFPRHEERTLQVGGRTLWRIIAELSLADELRLREVYLRHGDLGAAAAELLAGRAQPGGLTLADVDHSFYELSEAPGTKRKQELARALLARAAPLEAKYIIRIMTADLRIGLKESLVEETIARAFGQPLAAVQRANMLTGDIGETLRLAAQHQLATARLQVFHPIGFMLASPANSDEEAIECLPAGALVEDKYDGIRAQAHKQGDRVILFSRTLDEITEFPELIQALQAVPGEFILDGEIVAWKAGRVLPFRDLQKRLGRKQPPAELLAEIPVSLVAFDLLYENGELAMDAPLEARRARLATLLAGVRGERVQMAQAARVATTAELTRCFEAALGRGNEGVMVKDPHSPYTPGRRGKLWLKRKRPLATLDVVVTAVEYGHGKRRGLLSDYTFAVRDGERLVNIGKAYSGLTNEEILRMTSFFKEHTAEDEGWRLRVEPNVVLEVAFNNIQRSQRHGSGYALRFPRIVRLRPDKKADEIDTIEEVKRIYARQESASAGPSAQENEG